MILHPVEAQALCAYGGHSAARATSRSRTCLWATPGVTCVPGCAASQRDAWCVPDGAHDPWCDGHAWRPDNLGAMPATAAKLGSPWWLTNQFDDEGNALSKLLAALENGSAAQRAAILCALDRMAIGHVGIAQILERCACGL